MQPILPSPSATIPALPVSHPPTSDGAAPLPLAFEGAAPASGTSTPAVRTTPGTITYDALARRVARQPEETLPPPLFDESGHHAHFPHTAQSVLHYLDGLFAAGPQASPGMAQRGHLSGMLAALTGATPICPRLCLAILVIGKKSFPRIERKLVELAMLGAWKTDLPFAQRSLVLLNIEQQGYPDTNVYPAYLARAQAIADGYQELGLVPPGQAILDVGSGWGLLAMLWRVRGHAVTDLEPSEEYYRFVAAANPLWQPYARQIEQNRQASLPLSAQAFQQQHPERRFAVVNFSHFSMHHMGPPTAQLPGLHRLVQFINPSPGQQHIDPAGLPALMATLAHLTSADGRLLLGVSVNDPELISGFFKKALYRALRASFGQIEFIPATRFTRYQDHFSVGGQLGVFQCTLPRHAASTADNANAAAKAPGTGPH